MTTERATPGMEIPALLIAFVLAPLAYFAVWVVGWLLVLAVASAFGFSLEDKDDGGQFAGPLAGALCGGYWLLMLPVAFVLRSAGKLSFWTVVLPAAVLPTALIAMVALSASTQTGRNPLPWFLAASQLTVPGIVATAAAFWGLYCLFTGHRFLGPPPWRPNE